MSPRLDLPPERDLPAEKHREIRTALARTALRSTAPARPRRLRWGLVVTAVAVAAILGVGLGLVRPWSRSPVVALPAPAATTDPSPTDQPAAGQDIDLGPLDQGEQSRATAACAAAADHSPTVVKVLFARRTATDGNVIFVVDQDRHATFCFKSGVGTIAGPGSTELPQPTADRPVIQLMGPDLAASVDGEGQSRAAYAVGPEVERLEMRIVVDGRPGSWFVASVHDGYAWAGATVTDTHLDLDRLTMQVQDRAFDAAGRELPITHRR